MTDGFSFDHDFPEEIEQRPDDREDATIHNQPSSDLLGRSIDQHDRRRSAEGIVDGYKLLLNRSMAVEDGELSWRVQGRVWDSEAEERSVRSFQDSYGEQFVADAVFEKLVRRYSLEEHTLGMEDADAEA